MDHNGVGGAGPGGSGSDRLVDHYGGGDLLSAIDGALAEMGRDPAAITVDDLGPVDEFHVGGRSATEHLVEQLDVEPGAHLLDIGCGLGGTARLLASGPAGRVTGIDLTPGFVAAGQALNRRVGLDGRIDLRVGSALDLPYDDAGFDGAVMLHVGMNIGDKERLLAEVARVLRPGSRFALYDLMRVGNGPIRYPVPWSSEAATSEVAAPAAYRDAAAGVGFDLVAETDRTAEASAFFSRLRSGGPPSPLGLHLVMGPETPTKVANMVEAVQSGTLAPTEMVFIRS